MYIYIVNVIIESNWFTLRMIWDYSMDYLQPLAVSHCRNCRPVNGVVPAPTAPVPSPEGTSPAAVVGHWATDHMVVARFLACGFRALRYGSKMFEVWMYVVLYCMLSSGVCKSSAHQDNETACNMELPKWNCVCTCISLWRDCSHANWDVLITASSLPLVFEAHLGLRTLNALPVVFRC